MHNEQHCSGRHATGGIATGSIATCNGQHCNMQRSAWQHAEKTGFQIPDARNNKIGRNGQHCNIQRAALQRAALQRAIGRADNMQRCNMLLQPATCSVASTYNLQHAQRTACNGRHATGSVATDGIAAATRNGIATDRIATCRADIMQRTAVVRWYRAREPPARARVRREAARNGEGHFNAI